MTADEAAPTPDGTALSDVIRRARSDAYSALCERWGDRDAGPVSAHDEAVHMDRAALLAALGHTDCVPREQRDLWADDCKRAWAERDRVAAMAAVDRAERDRLREVVAPFVGVDRVDGVDYCPWCHSFTNEHMSCGCDFGRAREALREGD